MILVAPRSKSLARTARKMSGELSSRNKDCCVGQSMPFSVISTTRPSAEDIEQHVNHMAWSGSIVQPFVEWKRFNTFFRTRQITQQSVGPTRKCLAAKTER